MGMSSRYVLGFPPDPPQDIVNIFCDQAARKSIQPFLGSGQSKGLRPMQEMESRVLLYDLMNHGDRSLSSGVVVADGEVVPPGHWFLPIRRYVSATPLGKLKLP